MPSEKTTVIHDPGIGAFPKGAEFPVEQILNMLRENSFNPGTIIKINKVGNSHLKSFGFTEPGEYEIYQGHNPDGTPRQKARKI